MIVPFGKPRISTHAVAYKAKYKAFLLNKADELLFRNTDCSIADTGVQESAAPDGTGGGSAGGWNPTRQGLGGANNHTTRRAHRREAIARDPTTVATRRRNKTVPIWRLRRGGVAASATVCRTPLLTPEATPQAEHFRPDSARHFTPRRRTDGVSSQISHSAIQHGPH